MAQKLHDTYGFNYDNLKVLLGGWNTWLQENAKDPNAYPTEGNPSATTPGAGGDTGNPVLLITPAPTK